MTAQAEPAAIRSFVDERNELKLCFVPAGDRLFRTGADKAALGVEGVEKAELRDRHPRGYDNLVVIVESRCHRSRVVDQVSSLISSSYLVA